MPVQTQSWVPLQLALSVYLLVSLSFNVTSTSSVPKKSRVLLLYAENDLILSNFIFWEKANNRFLALFKSSYVTWYGQIGKIKLFYNVKNLSATFSSIFFLNQNCLLNMFYTIKPKIKTVFGK